MVENYDGSYPFKATRHRRVPFLPLLVRPSQSTRNLPRSVVRKYLVSELFHYYWLVKAGITTKPKISIKKLNYYFFFGGGGRVAPSPWLFPSFSYTSWCRFVFLFTYHSRTWRKSCAIKNIQQQTFHNLVFITYFIKKK